ncbi:hypothetical protein SCHPADRAFT_940860 [Schizopora paradoxa]|uniref:DUF6533 domain-containing protein n=1 Tax=Schizopora paradoxa TaxID=27342 RepID=A0A0H2S7V6_9AGAM|nr:hypothetical protein SCHPADRAFT_940860 [Schizopora paradoxa]
MSAVEQVQLEFAESIAREVWIYECVLVATFTVLVVEYFQTLEEEVRYVWKFKTTLANSLYLANRFVAPFNIALSIYVYGISKNLSMDRCYNGYVASASLCFFQIQAAYAVLCVRACAAWGFARIIKICLITSFIVSCAAEGYLIGRNIASDFTLPPGILGTTHCVIYTSTYVTIWVALIIAVVVDLLALSLLLVKSLNTFRESGFQISLLAVMAKDGIAYFACVFALSLGNLLVIVTPVPIFREMFLLTQAALQNALVVRLLLHLRIVNEGSDQASRATLSEFQVKHTTVNTEISDLDAME